MSDPTLAATDPTTTIAPSPPPNPPDPPDDRSEIGPASSAATGDESFATKPGPNAHRLTIPYFREINTFTLPKVDRRILRMVCHAFDEGMTPQEYLCCISEILDARVATSLESPKTRNYVKQIIESITQEKLPPFKRVIPFVISHLRTDTSRHIPGMNLREFVGTARRFLGEAGKQQLKEYQLKLAEYAMDESEAMSPSTQYSHSAARAIDMEREVNPKDPREDSHNQIQRNPVQRKLLSTSNLPDNGPGFSEQSGGKPNDKQRAMLIGWYQSDERRCFGATANLSAQQFIEDLEDKFDQYGITYESDMRTALAAVTVNPARSKVKRLKEATETYLELRGEFLKVYSHPLQQNRAMNQMLDLTLRKVQKESPHLSEGDSVLLLAKRITDSLPSIPPHSRTDQYLVETLNRALRFEDYSTAPLYWSAQTFDEKIDALQQLAPGAALTRKRRQALSSAETIGQRGIRPRGAPSINHTTSASEDQEGEADSGEEVEVPEEPAPVGEINNIEKRASGRYNQPRRRPGSRPYRPIIRDQVPTKGPDAGQPLAALKAKYKVPEGRQLNPFTEDGQLKRCRECQASWHFAGYHRLADKDREVMINLLSIAEDEGDLEKNEAPPQDTLQINNIIVSDIQPLNQSLASEIDPEDIETTLEGHLEANAMRHAFGAPIKSMHDLKNSQTSDLSGADLRAHVERARRQMSEGTPTIEVYRDGCGDIESKQILVNNISNQSRKAKGICLDTGATINCAGIEEAMAFQRDYRSYVRFNKIDPVAMMFGSHREISSLQIELIYPIGDLVFVYKGFIVQPDVPMLAGFAWQRHYRMSIDTASRQVTSRALAFEIPLQAGTTLPWLPLPELSFAKCHSGVETMIKAARFTNVPASDDLAPLPTIQADALRRALDSGHYNSVAFEVHAIATEPDHEADCRDLADALHLPENEPTELEISGGGEELQFLLINSISKAEIRRVHRHFGHQRFGPLKTFLSKVTNIKLDAETLQNLKEVIQECESCQRSGSRPVPFRVTLPSGEIVFNRDIVADPFWYLKKVCISFICMSTRWLAMGELRNMTTAEVITVFLSTWVYTYAGFPARFHVDAGTNLNSIELRRFATSNGMRITTAGVEQHSSLGIGESRHMLIKRMLRAVLAEKPKVPLKIALNIVSHACNNSMDENGICPSLLVFGTLSRPPIDLPYAYLNNDQRTIMAAAARQVFLEETARKRWRMTQKYNMPNDSVLLCHPGDEVMVYRDGTKSFEGPFRLVVIRGKIATLRDSNGQTTASTLRA